MKGRELKGRGGRKNVAEDEGKGIGIESVGWREEGGRR
jgi:hypothetical protein